MYYHVCVIMHVKEPQSLIAKSRASSPGDRLLLGQAHQPVSYGDLPRTRQDKDVANGGYIRATYMHLLCFIPKSSQISIGMVCFILLFCSTL